MSEEKQIEELIDAITCVDDNGYAYDSEGFEIAGYANSTKIAEALYEAGYRKQSEGEWETILHNPRGEMFNAYSHICKVEGCGYFYKDVRPYGYKFCPNCGAKMKGGAE